MDASQQFRILGQKQLAIQEGINLLQQNRAELVRNMGSAQAWGATAALANVALIPLNCIMNAFQVKSATSLYQHVVQELYKKFSASGSRTQGNTKVVLSSLKKVIVEELKRKGLTQYVPGVNILVGLSEDALAAFDVLHMTTRGNAEMRGLLVQIDRKIDQATKELLQIGIRRAEMLSTIHTA
jgi:hypothetical protein